MKIWRDDEIWGIYLKCRELPQLNLWNSFVIGEEKRLTHELLGGAAKVNITVTIPWYRVYQGFGHYKLDYGGLDLGLSYIR